MLRTLYRFVRSLVRRPANAVANRIDAPVLVLLYHRVAVLADDPQQLAVSPENFRAHVALLAARFPVLRFEDDWRPAARPAVVITFDDGYADYATAVLPILAAAQVPATFFIATGRLGSAAELWPTELDRILSRPGPFPERLKLATGAWPTATPAERARLVAELRQCLRHTPAAYRKTVLGQLRQWAGVSAVGRAEYRGLSAAELNALAASPLATLGSHTVNHSALRGLPVDEQRAELGQSKARLEAAAGRPVTTLAYPFGGRHDFDRETVRVCRELGYTKAAANIAGQAHRWTDPFAVPRLSVRDWPAAVFARNLRSFWTV